MRLKKETTEAAEDTEKNIKKSVSSVSSAVKINLRESV